MSTTKWLILIVLLYLTAATVVVASHVSAKQALGDASSSSTNHKDMRDTTESRKNEYTVEKDQEIEFLILPNISEPIIGVNALKTMGIIVDCSRDLLKHKASGFQVKCGALFVTRSKNEQWTLFYLLDSFDEKSENLQKVLRYAVFLEQFYQFEKIGKSQKWQTFSSYRLVREW